MALFTTIPQKPVLTPCIGICELDEVGLCAGCHRTSNEIAQWGSLPDAERIRIMDHVLPLRAMERERP